MVFVLALPLQAQWGVSKGSLLALTAGTFLPSSFGQLELK